MKTNPLFGFALSLVATGWILHLLAYNEKKVSLLSLERQMRDELLVKEEIGSHCGSLSADEAVAKDPEVKFFLRWLTPEDMNPKAPACRIAVRASSRHRFQLRAYWNYVVQVLPEGGAPFFERSFHLEFPRPLCFLPIAAFLLALVFEIPYWGVTWTLVTYLLLVSGGNAIRAMSLSVKSAALTFTTDQTLLGMMLIAFWIALGRSGRKKTIAREPAKPWQAITSRAATLTVGLWNPAFYTVMGRMLYPLKTRLARLLPFLDSQFLVAALSLYLLNIDRARPLQSLGESFFLPRYFTFATVLFVMLSFWSARAQHERVVWRLPHVWRPLLAIVVMEIASHFVPFLASYPKLLRIGVALVVSELAWPAGISLSGAFKQFMPWAGALFVASFITVVSTQAGVIDLFQVLWEPRVHPVGLVVFTFIAGIVLGFLTGNFSATFFALFPVILKPHESDLVKAALLDGILAGILLSPFSVFNLFPAVQFGIKLSDLMIFRLKQMAFPMAIGGAIYAVSAINSVAILRPVTFVFLCLLAVAFQLKKSAWKLGKFELDVPVGQGA